MKTFYSAVAAIIASGLPLIAGMTISFTPNLPTPQPVATPVTWTATVSDTSPGAHQYRFAASLNNGTPRIWRDYGNSNVWTWAFMSFEGLFNLTVTARNSSTGETASVSAPFELVSRLIAGYATVSPTAHPLVALFSRMPCMAPNSTRVRFVRVGEVRSQTTNSVPCRVVQGSPNPDLTSMNFYVAGMRANATYLMNWETVSPAGTNVHVGSQRVFETGSIPSSIPFAPVTVIAPAPDNGGDQPIVLQSLRQKGSSPYAHAAIDVQGNVLWYYYLPGSRILRTRPNGDFTVIQKDGPPTAASLREIDLAGNVLAETSVARVSEQLVARGFPKIYAFSHEVRRITNPGKANDAYIAVLGSAYLLSTQYQGGTTQQPVEIHGNDVIVLDRDLQLSWAWNPFVNLDLARAAVLGEKCTPTTVCRPQSPGVQVANDWMHTNTIYYSPWDGNLLISMRNQDWLVKLNYADGAGDGRVLWRMGPGGDFSITTNSTFGAHDIGFPWFSHQHDAEFEFGGAMTGGERTLTLFDNGNTRRATFDLKAHSRCQLYSVDEIARHVNLDRNGDVGTYSGALGSAQVLSNGAMSCDSGSIGSISQTVEIDTSDQLDYVVQWPGSTYRTFRMSDMYTPPTP